MTLIREMFDELLEDYDFTDFDAEKACRFVHDLLAAEADAIEDRYPYATVTIQELNTAAYKAFSVGGDICADSFGEE